MALWNFKATLKEIIHTHFPKSIPFIGTISLRMRNNIILRFPVAQEIPVLCFSLLLLCLNMLALLDLGADFATLNDIFQMVLLKFPSRLLRSFGHFWHGYTRNYVRNSNTRVWRKLLEQPYRCANGLST